MSARPTSIRIPDETRAAIEETCRRTGRDFTSVANGMLAEAVNRNDSQDRQDRTR